MLNIIPLFTYLLIKVIFTDLKIHQVVDDYQTYLIKVLQSKVFAVVDDLATVFVVQDYDQTLQRLLVRNLFLVC